MQYSVRSGAQITAHAVSSVLILHCASLVKTDSAIVTPTQRVCAAHAVSKSGPRVLTNQFVFIFAF